MDLKVDTSVFHMASFLDTNYAKRDYMFSNDWTVDWTHFCIGKWTFLWTRCVHSYMDHRMDTQCFPFFGLKMDTNILRYRVNRLDTSF